MIFKGRPTNTPQGALARLWRKIVKENNLEHSLGYLVTRYVARNAGEAKNVKRKTRSTLEADITAPEMTWKKFTHVVFQFLGAVRMDITIQLTFPNGTKTTHSVGIKSSDNAAAVTEAKTNDKENACTPENKSKEP